MQTPYLLLAAAVVAALSGWFGYSTGVDMEQGRHAIEMQKAIVATFDAARADARDQAKADERRTRARDKADAQVREVDREIAALPPRPGCDWTADELRLARARHCARYPNDAACRLPDRVPAAANATEPAQHVGDADRGLGIRLSGEASGVLGLGTPID